MEGALAWDLRGSETQLRCTVATVVRGRITEDEAPDDVHLPNNILISYPLPDCKVKSAHLSCAHGTTSDRP
jgi:hypothetical protein